MPCLNYQKHFSAHPMCATTVLELKDDPNHSVNYTKLNWYLTILHERVPLKRLRFIDRRIIHKAAI